MNDRKVIRGLLIAQWVLPIVVPVQNEFFLRGLPAPLRAASAWDC